MYFGSGPGPRVAVHPLPWWCYYRCPFLPHLSNEQSWHLTLWLGERDSSCNQDCGIRCLHHLFLHLFSSCSPPTTNACSFFCLPAGCSCLFLYFLAGPHAADAHHLLRGSCSVSFSLPALRWLLQHCSSVLLSLGDSVIQLPPFVWKRDRKQSVRSLCPK